VTAKLAIGLVCPHCSGTVTVPEGVRVLSCSHCDQPLFVQGEQGVRRWQVVATVDREKALAVVERFFGGMNMALTLRRQAEIKEAFLVYLPYWRVRATVAGWIFGWRKGEKDTRYPVEVEVFEEMHWADAATDVAEFNVHRVSVAHEDLMPYDGELLHAEAMVFKPTESGDEARGEAVQYFAERSRRQARLRDISSDSFYPLRKQLSIIYYPLWVIRYSYKRRNYQVIVDGRRERVLYGRAPGNIWYRALALVTTMALGNFVLVNGTALALTILFALADASDDMDFLLLLPLIPLAFGLGLIITGYRKFRFGAEVAEQLKESGRALDEGKPGEDDFFRQGIQIIGDLSESDLSRLFR
jgi:hypothetical protein